jgi:regulator of sigma E protease
VLLQRGEEEFEIEVETGSDPRYRLGFPGWNLIRESPEPTVIGDVRAGEPADKAGLKIGDRVLGADGKQPIGEVELRGLLAASTGRDVELVIQRGEQVLEIVVRPREFEGRGLIGVQFYTVAPRVQHSLAGALGAALRVNREWSKMLFLTLKKFARMEISPRAFSGPIEIARFSKAAMASGMESFLTFLAFISLQLGILNLLPIPVLDGGHILILGVEGVMRRDLTERIKERVMQGGLVFLLVFIGMILFYDVIKAWFS